MSKLCKVLMLNHEQGYQCNFLWVIVRTTNALCIIKKRKEVEKGSFLKTQSIVTVKTFDKH